jgi:hypothetical protein
MAAAAPAGFLVRRCRLTDPPIPEDVRLLLRDRVESLDELGIVLLLHLSAGSVWTPSEVAEKLRMPESAAEGGLSALAARELLVVTGDARNRRFSFSPRSDALRQATNRLAGVYRDDPLQIMRLISAHSMERIRNAAARAFADSFLLGRKPTDG